MWNLESGIWNRLPATCGKARLPSRRVVHPAAALLVLLLLALPIPALQAADPAGPAGYLRAYPPIRVAWARDRRLSGVLAVFPHPILPRRVLLATRAGLLVSNDAGRTWKSLPQAAAARLGRVTHAAFDPSDSARVYVATDSKGIWGTADGGKTFRQLGSKRAGMASDAATAVLLYPADMRHRTLLAIHGDAAPGISVSDDGGATWRVTDTTHHVHKLLCSAPRSRRLYMAAARTSAPDVRGIYSAASLGQPWYLVVRDVVPTDAALGPHTGRVLWATADSGLHAITHQGADSERLGPDGLANVASVAIVWGHHAGSEAIVAYEPTRLGMILSEDGMESQTVQSRGLYVGPLVREGAHVRANASATVFFAVANGTLSRGCRQDGALQVRNVAITPSAVPFARTTYHEATSRLRDALAAISAERYAAAGARGILQLTTQAESALASTRLQITANVGGRQARPAAVNVDLSALGGAARTPMHDDGQHADGAANDGLFATTFHLDPRHLGDRVRGGPLGLTVTALAADRSVFGAVGVLYPCAKPETVAFWNEGEPRSVFGGFHLEPQAALSFVSRPPHPYLGSRLLEVRAPRGYWTLPLGSIYNTLDITGYHALGFWIKADAPTRDPIHLQLRDAPRYTYSTDTPRVAVGPVAREFRHVVVPLAPLLARSPTFIKLLLGWTFFSGRTTAPRTYWIDDIRLFLTRDDLEAYRKRVTP